MQFPTGYHGRYLFAGPLVGGIFGCERYNMAHVIFVGNSPFPAEQAALDTVKVRQAVLPIPYAVPQPAPAMDFFAGRQSGVSSEVAAATTAVRGTG